MSDIDIDIEILKDALSKAIIRTDKAYERSCGPRGGNGYQPFATEKYTLERVLKAIENNDVSKINEIRRGYE